MVYLHAHSHCTHLSFFPWQGKAYKPTRDSLVRQDYVKSVELSEVSEEFASSPAAVGKRRACVLLRSYEEEDRMVEEGGGEGGVEEEDEGGEMGG